MVSYGSEQNFRVFNSKNCLFPSSLLMNYYGFTSFSRIYSMLNKIEMIKKLQLLMCRVASCMSAKTLSRTTLSKAIKNATLSLIALNTVMPSVVC